MSKFATPLRFFASALLAAAILLFGGGWLVHHYIGHEPSQTVGLKVIRGIQLITHIPGEDKAAADDKPVRMVNGFVQIAFTVGADGRAHKIHVLHAVPQGAYEAAARAVIAARHFKPAKSDRGALGERTEIVRFQVPATALKENKDDAKSGG